MNYYLSIDIGPSGGRHIVGWLENGEIKTEEVYRFSNGVEEEYGHLVWNIKSLFQNVKAGIREAFKRYPKIQSLAIDTWGYDYVLMQGDKEILPCYAYRDNRTEAVIKEAHALISYEELYLRNGIKFQPFNTVYQLLDDKRRGRLDIASDFLMIPEYLMYKLTGNKCKEYNDALTTGLVNVNTKEFNKEIIHKLGLPERLFPALLQPKTHIGMLKTNIAEEGGGQTQVVLCATHNTAGAVTFGKLKSQMETDPDSE